jgi:hypothetical protein
MRIRVDVKDNMQQAYFYDLVEPIGENFHPDFAPELTPKQMLELGVFGGKYMTDCQQEFPASWFESARLNSEQYDSDLNYFGVKASQPLSIWRKKGWIYPDDPRGWFQWYCRYYMGRRLGFEDERQIKRCRARPAISHKLRRIANRVISYAAVNNGRHSYIGRMIHGRCKHWQVLRCCRNFVTGFCLQTNSTDHPAEDETMNRVQQIPI